MSPVFIVRWGNSRYIVSRYSSSLLMFPGLAKLPRFELEADAIAHCAKLNSAAIAPISSVLKRDLELRRDLASEMVKAA